MPINSVPVNVFFEEDYKEKMTDNNMEALMDGQV